MGNDLSGAAKIILLVEDEENVRRVTGRLLERLGFSVLLASSAEEALALYEGQGARPDLVLTDVVMPGLTGIEMAERIRAMDPSLPIVFTSGYTSRELGRTPDDPPSPFLPKPFSLEDLERSVRDALDGSPGS